MTQKSGTEWSGRLRAVLRRTNQFVKSIKHTIRGLEARAKRRSSKAKFILVTGSSGKTTTVRLLDHILSADHCVLSQSEQNGIFDAIALLRRMGPNDQFVILEAGTTKPGEIQRIAAIFKPDIVIVTLVALEHYSAFRSIAAIALEKSAAVRGLGAHSLAILNGDNPDVRAMRDVTAAATKMFGQAGGDYKISDLTMQSNGQLALAIEYAKGRLSLQCPLIGEHNWLAAAAAVVCALELDVDTHRIAERLATFQPVTGRLSPHKVDDGPLFLLDSAKAPFHSIHLPIVALGKMAAPRKRVVIGQISDYAGNPLAKYRDTNRAAQAVADEVIAVGPASHRARPSPEDVANGRFRAFGSVRDAADYLKQTAIEGEIILVKSSINLHLERLWLSQVDTVECWAEDCGVKRSCEACNLYRAPFATHGGKAPKRRQ